MTIQPAGTVVDYTVTWLEMTARPEYDWPHQPGRGGASLLMAESPPAWYFLSLYDAVGRDYAWEDMHAQDQDDLSAWLADPGVCLVTLMARGWPQGFFMLDARDESATDLAYFGLVPESVGSGFGTFLLRTAILTAWEREGLERLTVNTCTLDHPRALQTYQKNGFTPVRRESFQRTLTRARDLSRIPD